MPTNRELLVRMEAENRRAAQADRPALKTLARLEKRIKARRQAFSAYEGYSINTPRIGDVLLHLRCRDGERKTIQIGPFGGMQWFNQPCATVSEILEVV